MTENFSKLQGFRYFFKGMRILATKGLRRYIVLPFLINVLIMGTGLWFGFGMARDWTSAMTASYLPDWLQWLTYLVDPIIFICFLVIIFYTFTLFALTLGAPFYSILSEKVQTIYYNNEPFSSKMSVKETIKDIPHLVFLELRKLMYRIPFMIVSIILMFIPVIGQAGAIILTSWCNAIDYTSYGYENNRYSLKVSRKNLTENKLLCISFGCTVWAALLIPFINLVMIPVAVAGGTMLWYEKLKPALPASGDDFPKGTAVGDIQHAPENRNPATTVTKSTETARK